MKPSATQKREKIGVEVPASAYNLILGLFFLSGLSGLIYEVLWTRMIVKIIGSAPFAVSIVLTVFMGGLALGSYIASRTIDRVTEPLRLVRFYGILELVIGGYAILLPSLLFLFELFYRNIYDRLFEYFLIYNFTTFVGCSLLLIIPTTCMGATLPVLSRFFITSMDRVSTHVGKLYGVNTIGAAAGALLSGFWLISYLGIKGALVLALSLNLAIGGTALLLARLGKEKKGRDAMTRETGPKRRERSQGSQDISLKASNGETISALVVFGVSGFCAMAYEVIWTKLLSLIVAPTTYSFTIVLVTFILGLALGSLIFGWLGDRVRDPIYVLLMTQGIAALFALWISHVLGNSQIFFAKLILHYKESFPQLQVLKAFILFFFLLFPTLFLGGTFPLVGRVCTRSLSRTGKAIGFAYTTNSIGAIAGSFCAGFLLVPLLGKEAGLKLVIAFQATSALFFGAYLFWKKRRRPSSRAPLALVTLITLILLFVFPHWDRKMLSIGRYHRFERPEIAKMGWVEALFQGNKEFAQDQEGDVVYFGDGIAGFTTVLKVKLDILENEGYALYISGKPEASSKLDMDTQTISAHFPMLFHRNPKRVLVIGLASGITAGEVLHYPVEKLDVVDINSQVVPASDFFIPWNNRVLSDPRTELIIQDARAHVALSRRKYDVISSEPSNPWMAGLASLFTRDFFSLVKGRLNEGGIFAQFIHTYQMDWPTFAMVGRTFSQVFPKGLLMRTNPSSLGPDFLLVGFKGDSGLDAQIASKNIAFARRSKNLSLKNYRSLYELIVSEDLRGLFGDGTINTDDWPRLEFSAPKLMHTNDPVIVRELRGNRRLSEETIGIVRENAGNIDYQIDYAEYALSVIRPGMPLPDFVDLSRASPLQRERYGHLLEEFCSNNVVSDFSSVEEEALRERCIAGQIQATLRGLKAAQNKVPLYLHLAELYSNIGMKGRALKNLQEALRIAPKNVDAHYDMAIFLSRNGRPEEAMGHYEEVLRLRPYHVDALNNMAWILATARSPKIRDGSRAVNLAELACQLSFDKDPFFVDTLAAAYAEAGRFDRAVATAKKAIEMARLHGDKELSEAIGRRLKLYDAGRPFHGGGQG